VTDPERIDYLAGQLSAHLAMFRALIRTHPDRVSLEICFAEAQQIQLAGTIPTRAPEHYVQGQADEYASLETLIRAR
jgi:hypothetical protein